MNTVPTETGTIPESLSDEVTESEVTESPSDKVTLFCRACKKTMQVDRHDTDPEGIVTIHINCPECIQGDFDSPEYFDATGEPIHE